MFHPRGFVQPGYFRCVVESLEGRMHFTISPIADAPRQVVDLQPDWLFFNGDIAGAEAAAIDDAQWAPVDLPHTWNAKDGQDGGDNYRRGVGWYRKSFAVPEDFAERQLFLRFDGASLVADVFIDGNFIGRHEGGFAAFTFDVTEHLSPGATNLIAVKVNNADNRDIAPISGPDVVHTGPDFTIFGGLYRGVSLVATEKLHVTLTDNSSPGVYLKQVRVTDELADVDVWTKVRNDAAADSNVTVTSDILDQEGNLVHRLIDTRLIPAGAEVQFSQDVTILQPRLWNGTLDPYMYDVVVQISDGQATTDVVTQPLGLRYFRVDPAQGFFLNGQPYALNGVNLHQDRLDKGWAVSPEDVAEDIALVDEMGANAIRLVHYQHAETTYDLLDQYGIAVWTEAPLNFDETDTAAFRLNLKRQLRELIRQNYNHPSILFWGLFNALEDNALSNAIVAELNDLAHVEDPSRKTIGAAVQRVPMNSKIHRQTDVIAVNDYSGWYRGDAESFGRFGDWVNTFRRSYRHRALGVAEFGAGANPSHHAQDPKTIDQYGPFHPEEYQNIFHESHLRQIKERPSLFGVFVFNMFDFAADDRDEGGIAGRNDKGLITYSRETKKDAFFLYKANWGEEPVVYITSRRARNLAGKLVDVKVYSNLPAIELFVNGQSLGVQEGDEIGVFEWKGVRLRSGANTVTASGAFGDEIITDSVGWGSSGTSAAQAASSDTFPTTPPPSAFSWGPASTAALLTDDESDADDSSRAALL